MGTRRSTLTALATVILMIMGMGGAALAASGGGSGHAEVGPAEGEAGGEAGEDGASGWFEFSGLPDLPGFPPDGFPPEGFPPGDGGNPLPDPPEAPGGCQEAADQLIDQIEAHSPQQVPQPVKDGIRTFCENAPGGGMPGPGDLPSPGDLPGLPGLPGGPGDGECDSTGPVSEGIAQGIAKFDKQAPPEADPLVDGANQLCNAIAQGESNVPSPGDGGENPLPDPPEAPAPPDCLCDSLDTVTDTLSGLAG